MCNQKDQRIYMCNQKDQRIYMCNQKDERIYMGYQKDQRTYMCYQKTLLNKLRTAYYVLPKDLKFCYHKIFNPEQPKVLQKPKDPNCATCTFVTSFTKLIYMPNGSVLQLCCH